MTVDKVQQGRAPIISLSGVTKRFGTAVAVRDVSLDLREGEFFCLLGPSGCGKSTLLRLLAGFEAIDSGRMELDGADLSRLPPERRPVNMMFQSYALFPHLSVAANIGYGLAGSGLSRAARTERVAEMVRLARLGGLETRRPDALSGGQRQRVALARALARRPRVLLLDEPLAALDRALRETTQAELKAVQRSLGTTFVMVTHDQAEALSLADRIGLMNAGELVQVGTPREIYDRPGDRFVAGFVGASNILPGTVAWRDGERCGLRLADGTEIEGRSEADLAPGQAAAAAIRTEAFTLSERTSAGAANVLVGTIAGTTFLGPATEIAVALACGETVRVAVPSATGAGGRERAAVTLSASPDAVRILP